MTVTVPSNDRTGAAALQAQITSLAAATATPANQQLLKQRQDDLVHSLLDQKKLNAATILSTVTINDTSHPLWAQRTTLQALVTSYGAKAPGNAAAFQLDALERQLVAELMASGKVTGATILAHPSLSYTGRAGV